MRIAIDYNTERDEISLFSEVADNSCAESCINFIALNAENVTVHFKRNGKTTETKIPVVNCVACYVLDDAAMRTAGEFTVCAAGKSEMRFVIEQAIPTGIEYSVSLTKDVFYVRSVSLNAGDVENIGMFAFSIIENGHLICMYDTDNPPPLSINENGHLIYTIGG